MSNEDLQFHYFKVHDSDNDDKLDGIELATAMAHYHDEENGEKPEDYTEEVRVFLLSVLIRQLILVSLVTLLARKNGSVKRFCTDKYF